MATDLSKQQTLDADPKAIQQVKFTANLDRAGSTRICFILEEAKKNYSKLFTGNGKSIVNMLYNNFWSNIK